MNHMLRKQLRDPNGLARFRRNVELQVLLEDLLLDVNCESALLVPNTTLIGPSHWFAPPKFICLNRIMQHGENAERLRQRLEKHIDWNLAHNSDAARVVQTKDFVKVDNIFLLDSKQSYLAGIFKMDAFSSVSMPIFLRDFVVAGAGSAAPANPPPPEADVLAVLVCLNKISLSTGRLTSFSAADMVDIQNCAVAIAESGRKMGTPRAAMSQAKDPAAIAERFRKGIASLQRRKALDAADAADVPTSSSTSTSTIDADCLAHDARPKHHLMMAERVKAEHSYC
uniref:Uncharacterized protein n=1 Tax=Haptolina brevifila TaxID=156173 RepID=A0A7S2IYG7_9EUKA